MISATFLIERFLWQSSTSFLLLTLQIIFLIASGLRKYSFQSGPRNSRTEGKLVGSDSCEHSFQSGPTASGRENCLLKLSTMLGFSSFSSSAFSPSNSSIHD